MRLVVGFNSSVFTGGTSLMRVEGGPGPPLDLSPLLRDAAEVPCGLGAPAASRPDIPKVLSLLSLPEGHEGPLQGLHPLLGPLSDGLHMAEELAYTGQHCLV